MLVVVEITSRPGTITEEVVATDAEAVETEEGYGTRLGGPIVEMTGMAVVALDQEAGVIVMEDDGVVAAVTMEHPCPLIIGGKKTVPVTDIMEVVGVMVDVVVEEAMIDGEEEDPTLLRIGRSLYQEMIDSRMSCLDLAMGLLGLTLTDTRTSLWKLLVRMFQRE